MAQSRASEFPHPNGCNRNPRASRHRTRSPQRPILHQHRRLPIPKRAPLRPPFPRPHKLPEINLRYYVRRTVGTEVRRGVVFAREIVSRRAVSIVANHIYNEKYITRPMRSEVQIAGPELAPNDTIEYAWNAHPSRSRLRAKSNHWNRLAAQVAAPLALPTPGSLEGFIVEHYWGYTHGRDDQTREYQIAHNPWQVAPADNVTWNCDIPANYNPPLAEYLTAPPTSAIIADGSPVPVYRGHCC